MRGQTNHYPAVEKGILAALMSRTAAAVALNGDVETDTRDAPRAIRYDKIQGLCQYLKHTREVPN